MMLYLDTSALVKLYVDEPLHKNSRLPWMRQERSPRPCWPMLKPGRRGSLLCVSSHRRSFEEDWPRYMTVEITDRLVKHAGDLAASRGYDALHVASALSLHERVPSTVMFLAFDRELSVAAKRDALRIHPLGA